MAPVGSHTRSNKTPIQHDYLVPSKHLTSSPGLGASFAEDGVGTLSDNHGNVLIGHELIFSVGHDVRCYDLTDLQWRRLVAAITPSANAADRSMRDDNVIPVLGNLPSPLETTKRDLLKSGAPFTKLFARN